MEPRAVPALWNPGPYRPYGTPGRTGPMEPRAVPALWNPGPYRPYGTLGRTGPVRTTKQHVEGGIIRPRGSVHESFHERGKRDDPGDRRPLHPLHLLADRA